MRKKKKLVVANWKLNPATLDEAKGIFKKVKRTAGSLRKVETVICPPFPFIEPLARTSGKSSVSLGAQDVFWLPDGAFTGQVSSRMVQSVGAKFVIIGHSERRQLGDTDEIVSKKVNAALTAGLWVIICIGEKERDRNGDYFTLLKNQIKNSLFDVPKQYLPRVVIAYEPLFAVGADFASAMKPTDVHQMSIFVKKVIAELYGQARALDMTVLYGGAVHPDNAALLVAGGEVDGLLVGRESLNADDFVAILKIINGL